MNFKLGLEPLHEQTKKGKVPVSFACQEFPRNLWIPTGEHLFNGHNYAILS